MAAKTKSFATAEDSAEVSLEIWADGPKAESEIADKPGSPGSPLLLTDFSRSCAKLWRSIFGARFACRKPRKDTGRTFPDRIVGTSEGVHAQHGRALKRLVGVAGADQLNAPAACRDIVSGCTRALGDMRPNLHTGHTPPSGRGSPCAARHTGHTHI